jgi:RPA family protein
MTEQQFKRNIAYKLRIGQILSGKPILEAEKLKSLELEGKNVVRVNVIANVIEKYIQDGEKKYASMTIDDATGQIALKFFGDDVDKMKDFNQGDTVIVIGLLRSWNNQIYVTPEILKKKDPSFLLVRKLEIESEMPKSLDKTQITQLKDKLVEMIKAKEAEGGLEVEKAILELKESPDHINKEIKKLLEEGLIYEPRPGRLRWLG